MFVAQVQSTHSGRWVLRRDVTDCKHRRRIWKAGAALHRHAARWVPFGQSPAR